MAIVDLHCDLLSYLADHPSRTPYDEAIGCSIPKLQAGGVSLQVMALFAETGPESVAACAAQLALFATLPTDMAFLPAIENASCLCGEEEPLANAFSRIERMVKPVYIGLTWNTDNRFGGAAGLTADGRELLAFLQGRRIAVDLSHATDRLAYDIIDEMEKMGGDLPLIASHSNARAVANVPRNLPDELIVEIVKRRGLIGLNFVRPFLVSLKQQVDHFLTLGAGDVLCYGADFFYGDDPRSSMRKPKEGWYFPELADATSYRMAGQMMGIDAMQLQRIESENARRFLKECIL